MDDTGVAHSFNHYKEEINCFHKEFYLDDGILKSKPIFGPRLRSANEEEKYRLELLMSTKDTNRLLLHNHIDPITPEIKEYLLGAGENIFIYRKNKMSQLASYAIAYVTGSFFQFKNNNRNICVDSIPESAVIDLIRRIKIWENANKESGTVIAYEDIDFYDKEGFLCKQVKDYTKFLTPDALQHLRDIHDRYFV